MADVISVSALNRYVKGLLDADGKLFDLALRGEVTNFVQNARSGHCYFSLRDEGCSVRAVMFRSDTRRLGFRPEEGMRVVVRCRVTLYERDGAFQVYVSEMFPDGIGVVDARHLFGIGAVKPEQNIDLVVRFEQWDDNKAYDRLGLEQETTTILGVEVPLNVIPVRPGRNLGSILELAAMNNREKKMGYNAAQVLVDRYDKIIDEG